LWNFEHIEPCKIVNTQVVKIEILELLLQLIFLDSHGNFRVLAEENGSWAIGKKNSNMIVQGYLQLNLVFSNSWHIVQCTPKEI
jgi:hypothetical protein